MKLSDVPVVQEGRRGCGFRKGGGLYLRTDAAGQPCGKLPFDLNTCSCCGAGIKQTRGWTWVEPARLFEGVKCAGMALSPGSVLKLQDGCATFCPLSDARIAWMGRAGLLWIGTQFYPTPEDFLDEALHWGLSRRIKTIPHGFKLGETWVCCAHAHHHRDLLTGKWQAAIFRVFKPQRIEYVCKGDETEGQLQKLVERGISPVRVERVGQVEMFPQPAKGD